jgi:hypothetical protein
VQHARLPVGSPLVVTAAYPDLVYIAIILVYLIYKGCVEGSRAAEDLVVEKRGTNVDNTAGHRDFRPVMNIFVRRAPAGQTRFTVAAAALEKT